MDVCRARRACSRASSVVSVFGFGWVRERVRMAGPSRVRGGTRQHVTRPPRAGPAGRLGGPSGVSGEGLPGQREPGSVDPGGVRCRVVHRHPCRAVTHASAIPRRESARLGAEYSGRAAKDEYGAHHKPSYRSGPHVAHRSHDADGLVLARRTQRQRLPSMARPARRAASRFRPIRPVDQPGGRADRPATLTG